MINVAIRFQSFAIDIDYDPIKRHLPRHLVAMGCYYHPIPGKESGSRRSDRHGHLNLIARFEAALCWFIIRAGKRESDKMEF